jgi:hypothetical protein
MAEDDLRLLVREFRASVSSDLESQHQRLDELADEMRRRITIAESTIVNELRSLATRLDLRLGRIEARLNELEGL